MFTLTVLNGLIVMHCTLTTSLGVWFRQDIGKNVEADVSSITGVNITETAFVGLCVKRSHPKIIFVFHTIMLAIRSSLFIVGFYCAYQVKKKLKFSSMNGATKLLQRRFSNMLLGQIFCLAVLLQPPLTVQPFLMHIGGASSSAVIFTFTVMLSLIPVLSPLIFIISLCEIGSFISKMFKQYKVPQIFPF
ncbi:hypothetical protein Y032_0003g1174 [Ancylostoma ceylanicum]|nr:hypothetical protein Y032_0003g1174 [Ancylostoma ceylanicum]